MLRAIYILRITDADRRDHIISPGMMQWKEHFDRGVLSFREKKYEAALDAFNQVKHFLDISDSTLVPDLVFRP